MVAVPAPVPNVPSGSEVESVTVPVYDVGAMFPKASVASTVKPWASPATVGDGYPVIVNLESAAGVTLIPDSEPVKLLTLSSAVIDHVPTLRSVAPLVNVFVP